MIGRLVGLVVEEEATGALMVDVGGVGYELSCPVGTVGRAKDPNSSIGAQVTLYVHTSLRQDALELFGFCSLEERATFRHLTSVPGVGPRLAIAVLNVLPAKELVHVIEAEDKARMVKVPGVGKKTAERLVLELRGKLAASSSSSGSISGNPNALALPTDLDSRLVAALTGLGYRSTEAEKAAKAVIEKETDSDLSLLLRKALDHLAP